MPIRLTTKEFIERAGKIHGNKYKYSKVEYLNDKKKVAIICRKHDVFFQTPSKHLTGQGCPKCAGRNKTTEDFVREAKIIHGNKYGYSSVMFETVCNKVAIFCFKHNIFFQEPRAHLRGDGCPKCAGKNKTTEDFIREAKIIHGNKYGYSLFEYTNAHTASAITCKKHGMFYQTPNNHLHSKNSTGCPKCSSSKGEKQIREWLIKNNVSFKEQKKFNGCNYKQKLKFDFYLPEHNTLIEYDGELHFMETTLKNNLSKSLIKDQIKDKFCINNNINLIRIGFWENIDEILEDWKKTLGRMICPIGL